MLGGIDLHTIAAAVRRALAPLLGVIGPDGYSLRAESGAPAGALWEPPVFSDCPLVNGHLVQSEAGSALTIAVKTWAGIDATPANPIYVLMRDSAAASDLTLIRKITGPLSIVIPSTATLGHASGINQHLFVYLIDNAGAIELAVSNLPPDYPGTFGVARTISTTQIAAASNSATTVYSTTARAGVAWVALSKCVSNQAAAGTWATALAKMDMAPFVIPKNDVSAFRNTSAQAVATGAASKVLLNGETFDTDGVFDNVTNFRYQPNVAGLYRVGAGAFFQSIPDQVGINVLLFKNGSQAKATQVHGSGTSDLAITVVGLFYMNGTSDYIELYAAHQAGSNRNILNGADLTFLDISRA